MPDWYSLVRPLLFSIPPESAHGLTLGALRIAQRAGVLRPFSPPMRQSPLTLMGLHFANRLGIAAGLDKNGTCIDAWGELGFGFVEVGTVTPRPQGGNPRPRLFRLVRDQALINRMGFPNDGTAALAERLRRRRFAGPCGVNIGKNADRSLISAADDYIACLNAVYPFADYIAVNISSPNTRDLRSLQHAHRLEALLDTLVAARAVQRQAHGRTIPLLVKLAADLDDEALASAALTARGCGIDGLIVSNTTLSRDGVLDPAAGEEGGLSGPPLRARAVHAVRCLRAVLGRDFPLIGVGGIDSADAAGEMLRAGADLLQIYTGLVYRGPALIRDIASVPNA